MREHSPTPWRKIAGSIVGADNDPICHMAQVHPGVRGDERQIPAVDAEFITRACNAHDEMLTALKGLVGALTQAYGPMSDEVADRVGELAAKPWRASLAAIAKAEGRS